MADELTTKFITIRVKGYAGPGWEIECTGPRKWVEKAIKKYIPRVKSYAQWNTRVSYGTTQH